MGRIRNKLERAARRATQRLIGRAGEVAGLPDTYVAVEPSMPSTDTLLSQIEELKRHKREFFDLIERIEAQRDEWKEMFKRDAAQHLQALGILEIALKAERVRIARLLVYLNKLRDKEGLDPIKTPKHLDTELGLEAPPVNTVKERVQEIRELFQMGDADSVRKRAGKPRPADIDAKAERDKLCAGHDEDPAA